MKEVIKQYVYRGAKYTLNSLSEVSKKYLRHELIYRGTKYIEQLPQKISESGVKMSYRGVSYTF